MDFFGILKSFFFCFTLCETSRKCRYVDNIKSCFVLFKNAKEAIESYIGSLKKHKEPIPEDVGEEVILDA